MQMGFEQHYPCIPCMFLPHQVLFLTLCFKLVPCSFHLIFPFCKTAQSMDRHGLVQEYLLHVHIYHQIFSSLFFTCRDEEPVEINYNINIAVGKDGTNQFLQFVMFHMMYRCPRDIVSEMLKQGPTLPALCSSS